MNISIVLAGGTGSRTGNFVPKQYLTVFDIPIIIYTIKNIEASGLFDAIYVVCSEKWADFVESYTKQYGISHFCGTIKAGTSRFESMFNGALFAAKKHNENDTIFFIDANRPLIPHRVFFDMEKKMEHSECILALEPCYDSMYMADSDKKAVLSEINRDTLFKGQAPEATKIKTAVDILTRASNDNNTAKALSSIMLDYGVMVSSVEGSSKSFKITTADDIEIFRALADNVQF